MPRVGVDIGGTFTDIVFLASTGERFTRKVPSTVDNDSRAITEGIAAVLADLGETGKSILELLTGPAAPSVDADVTRALRARLAAKRGWATPPVVSC